MTAEIRQGNVFVFVQKPRARIGPEYGACYRFPERYSTHTRISHLAKYLLNYRKSYNILCPYSISFFSLHDSYAGSNGRFPAFARYVRESSSAQNRNHNRPCDAFPELNLLSGALLLRRGGRPAASSSIKVRRGRPLTGGETVEFHVRTASHKSIRYRYKRFKKKKNRERK